MSCIGMNKKIPIPLHCYCSVQAGYLKAIMLAAADVAASRFSDLAGNAVEVIDREDRIYSNSDHIFRHFDKNRDGVISMDELQQVIRDLGADSNGSHDLMRIVDSNLDGSVCAEEFQNFCRQVLNPLLISACSCSSIVVHNLALRVHGIFILRMMGTVKSPAEPNSNNFCRTTTL
jgi:hypothetical protein